MALAGVYNKGGSAHSQGTLLRLGKRSGTALDISEVEQQLDSVSAPPLYNELEDYQRTTRATYHEYSHLSVGLMLNILSELVRSERRSREYDFMKRKTKMTLNALG